MDITTKTWRSGGVDIRSGSDGDAGQDPAVGSSPTSGGIYSTQGSTSSSGSHGWTVSSNSGSISSGTLSSNVPYNNSAVQNLLNHIASLGTQSLSGFINKRTNLFSIQFIGFDGFNHISSTGYKNAEILDEQTLAMTSIGRTKAGWSTVDFAIMDDVGNDVLNILNEQFNYQTANAETFDVVIEYYDDQGNTTATTYFYGCTIEEFSSDPLNAAHSSKTEMKVILTVQPRTVTFS